MPDQRQGHFPIVAITMGDPCGIGPEVIVKAFGSPEFTSGCIPFVLGDGLPIERAMHLLGSKSVILPVTDIGSAINAISGAQSAGEPCPIPLFSPGKLTQADIAYGHPSAAACALAVSSIEGAVKMALAKKVDAICTCPVNKAQLHGNGFPFPGHTEFIRDLTGTQEVIMMLAGPKLRVALVTIHEPLEDVPRLLTKERLRITIRITAHAMERDFGMSFPHIAVAGLNPHAGEAGKFGRQELEIIQPVIEEYEKRPVPWQISGPWPADTVFNRALSGEFDAVIAMYHDQGLIPVKLAHFSEAVNVSLGLPIVRTSVDHGTAYDLAGTGKADPGSLIAAVKLASAIAKNRLQFGQNQPDGM
jgi:4-hydroxythreonine-4-phosphate dehydrogenase